MLHSHGDSLRLILVYVGTFCTVIFLCGCCDPADKEALLEFKSRLVDSGKDLLSTWNNDTNCCEWKDCSGSRDCAGIKVTCSNETAGRVIELSLKINETSRELARPNISHEGTFGSSLGKLEGLQVLHVEHMTFEGPLPAEWANLKNLQTLYCANCSFGGSIDGFPWANLPNLTELSLRGNNLSGSIPMSIGSFSALRKLDLSQNQISGQIPTSLCNVRSLEWISLNSNQLSETIPECLALLPNLRILMLDNNRLSGNFPLSLLRILWVWANNNFLAGWSSDVYTTVNNGYLNLASNNLSGPLPSALCNLSSSSAPIKNLDLSNNFLTGGLLPCLGELGIVIMFNMSYNSLDGEIPATFGNGMYYILGLRGNHLSGKIDRVFTKENYNATVPNMNYLDLSSNQLLGPVPKDLALHSVLKYLNLADNQLQGGFPPCVFNLSKLETLVLSHNEFRGPLPSYLPRFARNLSRLSLGDNSFSGRIPADDEDDPHVDCLSESSSSDGSWHNCALVSFSVRNNNLTGVIPNTFRCCRNLLLFDARNNQFNGPLPSWLYTNTHLRVFVVSNNQIEGIIPDEFGLSGLQNSSLQMLDLSNNKLQGQIPSRTLYSLQYFRDSSGSKERHNRFVKSLLEYRESVLISFKGGSNVVTLIYSLYAPILLDFSSNQLTGPIPSNFSFLSQIKSIKLSNNFLNGTIPTGMANMSQIETMEMSNNSLRGLIPSDFSQLDSLSGVNFSYNHLCGPIPVGTQLTTFPESAFMHNDCLCGPPINVSCTDSPSPSVPIFGPASPLNSYIPGFVLGYILSFFICSYFFIFGNPRRPSGKVSVSPLF